MLLLSVDKIEYIWSLFLTLAIAAWLYWLWTRRSWYKFSFQFPGDLGLPIIGSFLKVRHVNNILSVFTELFEKCRQHTICMWLGLYPILLTADPDIIEKVLTSTEFLQKAHPYYVPVYDLFKGGIATSPVEKWAHNRKMINPAFNSKVLMSFFPIFNKAKNSVVEKFASLVDNKEHKLLQILTQISVNVTVETTLGKVMGEGDETYADIGENIAFILEKLSMICVLTSVKLYRLVRFYSKYNRTKEYFYNLISELVKQRINNSTNTTETINDQECLDTKTPSIFIDQAIRLYRNGKLSWNDIISESNTIFSAGSETTANCVFSTLVMLATHTTVQERLFEEILNVFPENTFEVEYAHLQQLPYLHLILNETLRLVPPIPMIGRHIAKDTQLRQGLTVPKDVQIFISIFHLHRRKDIWGSNADQFVPERFLPGHIQHMHSSAFMPFSKGARNCIGSRYAMYVLKVLLCGIIRNYRFTTNLRYEDIQLTYNTALKYFKEPAFRIYERQ